MTEPGTGSDLQNIKAKAIREGDEYVVNGSKIFITNGAQADVVVTVVKTNPEEAAAGISLVIVPTDTPGFSRGKVLDKVGMKGQDTSESVLRGRPDPGHQPARQRGGPGLHPGSWSRLPQERLIVAVSNVAAMEFCYDETMRYVHERHAFNRPIWGFQNTKFKMAEVATEARVARSFVDECITLHLEGQARHPDGRDGQARGAPSARRRSRTSACRLHGGYGYMNEYPIARAWADLRVSQIYAGTSEIMKEIISRSLPAPRLTLARRT
ncbi:acyl-CoA dehydrogenase family protein [Nocardioides convexus]|uniref:acyl-CoA dehydrogenase family protein n=1 Tax=Nocardioides convexus TaxID=2712224 RepID=UPI0024182C46|nr:acyl-CoA dehydrogenase family protein [Nocardioides convexus]